MIYKRGKVWYMDFTINGIRVNRSTKTDKKALARKVEDSERTKVLLNCVSPVGEGALLKDRIEDTYANRWQSQAGGEQSYERLQVILNWLGNININIIDRPMLKQLRLNLAEAGRGSTTINRYMTNLKTVLMDAQRDGLLTRVPHFDMAREAKVKTIVNTLSKDGEAAILSAAEKDLHDIIIVAIDTGLRLGEIIKLTGSHIAGGAIVLQSEDTKTGNARVVPVTDRAFDILESRMSSRPEEALLFTSWAGKPLKSSNVSKAFTGLRRAAGFNNKVTFHCLRHTFATRYLAEGGNIRKLQQILGHASIVTTERYTHVS